MVGKEDIGFFAIVKLENKGYNPRSCFIWKKGAYKVISRDITTNVKNMGGPRKLDKVFHDEVLRESRGFKSSKAFIKWENSEILQSLIIEKKEYEEKKYMFP